MSEPTKKPEEGIVVGGKRSQKGLNVNMSGIGRRLARILLLLVLIVALAVAGYYSYSHFRHKQTTLNNNLRAVKPGPSYVGAESVLDKYQADKSANPTGAFNTAESTLAELEKRATSAKDKEAYALALIQLYDQANKSNAAIKKAKQAESDYHSASTAARLAAEYQLTGDKSNAIKYYQLAVSRSPKTAPTARSAYNDYRLELQSLEAQ